MGTEFKSGTISDFLAKECGGSQADPKLAALFSSSSPKVFKKVKVKDSDFSKKSTVNEEVEDSEVEVNLKSKKADKLVAKTKKKRKVDLDLVQEEEEHDQELDEGQIKKKKRKKDKRKQILLKEPAAEEDVKEEPDDVEEEEEETQPEENQGDEKPGTEKPLIRLSERNAPKDKDPELEARTLFVGNVPGDTGKKVLIKIFKPFGKIETIRLRGGAPSKPTQLKKVAINKKELHAHKNTLCAFIRFSSREEAELARSKCKGVMVKDNHLSIDLADEGNKKDNKKAIFVGNLHIKLTDEELWRFFEDCGEISSVRIVRDNATGVGKGFGYVNFENAESIVIALKKNEEELRNRSIRISRCVKKVKKEKKSKVKKGSTSKKPGPKPWLIQNQKKNEKTGYLRRKAEKAGVNEEYGGDRLAEIGKLKRKSNKINRGESRKMKFAKMLASGSADGKNKKKRFK